MLHIFHAVDVPIDIHIAVVRLYLPRPLALVAHSYARRSSNRTNRFLIYILRDGTFFDRQNVGRLARFGVDHRPDAASVAIDFARLVV